jgi:hypothetical protein
MLSYSSVAVSVRYPLSNIKITVKRVDKPQFFNRHRMRSTTQSVNFFAFTESFGVTEFMVSQF